MRRSNPALPRISLFEFQARAIGRLRIPFEIERPLLAVQRGRCDGKPRDAAVRFYGHQNCRRACQMSRQEPGRDDRGRLSGRHARDARLHNERGQVLVPAHPIESLIDSLGDQAS
jgi:hypothetical protein